MEMELTISNNKEFKHDSDLEEDFDFDLDDFDDNEDEVLFLYRKYHQNLSWKIEYIECRETLLDIFWNIKDYQEPIFISLELENVNPRLVTYVVNNCKISSFISDFITTPKGFNFTYNVTTGEFNHFISFLVLLCAESFSNIKTRTKVNDIWEDRTRENIAEQIIKVIEDLKDEDGDYYECEIDSFEINNPDDLIGYINYVLKDNKTISTSRYCTGPESAFSSFLK
jgi:hypothetical protein